MEEWKDIEEYEGMYQISNLGRVKSLSRKYSPKEYILKQKTQANGYLSVTLFKNGIGQTLTVHRLVAKAFIPNPNNLSQVNHLDENKTKNIVDNLKWCSPKENCNFGTRNTRIKEKVITQPREANGNFAKRC